MQTCFRGHTFSGWSCPTCDTIDALDRQREAGERAAKSAAKEGREAVRRDEALIEEQREAAERESEVREEEANFRAWQAEEQADRLAEINRSALDEQRRIASEATAAQRRIAAEAVEAQRRIAANAWQAEAQSKIDRAKDLLKAGLGRDALSLLQEATRQDPGNFEGHHYSCEAALTEGIKDLAIEELVKCARLVAAQYDQARFDAVTSIVVRHPKEFAPNSLEQALSVLDSVSQQNPLFSSELSLAAASLASGWVNIALRPLRRCFQSLSTVYRRPQMEALCALLGRYRQVLPSEVDSLVEGLINSSSFRFAWEAHFGSLGGFSGPVGALAALKVARFETAGFELASQAITLGTDTRARLDPDYWSDTVALIIEGGLDGHVLEQFQKSLKAAIPDLVQGFSRYAQNITGLLSQLIRTTDAGFDTTVRQLVSEVIKLGTDSPARLDTDYWSNTLVLIKEGGLQDDALRQFGDSLRAAIPDLAVASWEDAQVMRKSKAPLSELLFTLEENALQEQAEAVRQALREAVLRDANAAETATDREVLLQRIQDQRAVLLHMVSDGRLELVRAFLTAVQAVAEGAIRDASDEWCAGTPGSDARRQALSKLFAALAVRDRLPEVISLHGNTEPVDITSLPLWSSIESADREAFLSCWESNRGELSDAERSRVGQCFPLIVEKWKPLIAEEAAADATPLFLAHRFVPTGDRRTGFILGAVIFFMAMGLSSSLRLQGQPAVATQGIAALVGLALGLWYSRHHSERQEEERERVWKEYYEREFHRRLANVKAILE